MSKILNEEEFQEEIHKNSSLQNLRFKKGKPLYSEEYIVKFDELQPDNTWQKKTVFYYSEHKGKGKDVETKWKADYKDKQVTLFSINYV